MVGVFLDTGLFVALVYRDDVNHSRARELTDQLIRGDHGRPLQTSTPVLVETIAMIHCKSKGSGKEERAFVKVEWLFSFIRSYNIELNFTTDDWLEQAKRLYQERRGFLDFVDTLNVAFLRSNNITNIVSFDSDYDQFSTEGIFRIS